MRWLTAVVGSSLSVCPSLCTGLRGDPWGDASSPEEYPCESTSCWRRYRTLGTRSSCPDVRFGSLCDLSSSASSETFLSESFWTAAPVDRATLSAVCSSVVRSGGGRVDWCVGLRDSAEGGVWRVCVVCAGVGVREEVELDLFLLRGRLLPEVVEE